MKKRQDEAPEIERRETAEHPSDEQAEPKPTPFKALFAAIKSELPVILGALFGYTLAQITRALLRSLMK